MASSARRFRPPGRESYSRHTACLFVCSEQRLAYLVAQMTRSLLESSLLFFCEEEGSYGALAPCPPLPPSCTGARRFHARVRGSVHVCVCARAPRPLPWPLGPLAPWPLGPLVPWPRACAFLWQRSASRDCASSASRMPCKSWRAI